MPKCIYCGAFFETATDEHILQNSLGARWVSAQIVCSQDQRNFGDTIDCELADQTEVFRNLFNHETGRRGPAPTLRNLPTVDGKKVGLAPGGALQLEQPEIIITDHPSIPGAKAVEIQMRDQRDAAWALHLLKKKLPEAKINVDEVLAHVKPTKPLVEDVVILRAPTGGHDYHRATAKAAFNLAGACGVDLTSPCFDDFRSFVLRGTGDSADFVRFAAAHDFAPQTKLGEIDHFLAVHGTGSAVEAYVQLYGGLQYVIRMTSDYSGAPFSHGYLVNPLRDTEPPETRMPVFDSALLPLFDRQPRLADETTRAWMETKLTALMHYYFSAATKRRLAEIIDEVLLPHDGKPITAEMLRALAEKVATEFAPMLGRRRDLLGK